MDVIITEWALNSYLELKSKTSFTENEYRKIIRPDVLRLGTYPEDPKFKQGKFWSIAQDQAGLSITNGYKMKWHQIGNGCVQLRLTVGILKNECLLCKAYVKKAKKIEKRKLAMFKVYLQLIRNNRYIFRGKLT